MITVLSTMLLGLFLGSLGVILYSLYGITHQHHWATTMLFRIKQTAWFLKRHDLSMLHTGYHNHLIRWQHVIQLAQSIIGDDRLTALQLVSTSLYQHSYLGLKWGSLGLLLCGLAALDGQMQRLIRRWSGGRESMMLPQLTKKFTALAATLAGVSSIVLPGPVTLIAAVVMSCYLFAMIAVQQHHRSLSKYR